MRLRRAARLLDSPASPSSWGTGGVGGFGRGATKVGFWKVLEWPRELRNRVTPCGGWMPFLVDLHKTTFLMRPAEARNSLDKKRLRSLIGT